MGGFRAECPLHSQNWEPLASQAAAATSVCTSPSLAAATTTSATAQPTPLRNCALEWAAQTMPLTSVTKTPDAVASCRLSMEERTMVSLLGC